MNKILKWVMITLLPLLIIGGILFFIGKDLQKVTLEKFEINGLEEITTDSFTINGNFYLRNPSKLSLPIKTIEYTVLLKDNQQILSSGSLPEFTLERNAVTKTVFYQKVKFLPSIALAIELLTKEKVFIVIKGAIIVDLLEVNKYEIPFETDVDIKAVFIEQGKKKLLIDDKQNSAGKDTLVGNGLI